MQTDSSTQCVECGEKCKNATAFARHTMLVHQSHLSPPYSSVESSDESSDDTDGKDDTEEQDTQEQEDTYNSSDEEYQTRNLYRNRDTLTRVILFFFSPIS